MVLLLFVGMKLKLFLLLLIERMSKYDIVIDRKVKILLLIV